MLIVSYCDRLISVVRCPLSVVPRGASTFVIKFAYVKKKNKIVPHQ